jgi:diacylglycerol O-acyltransferase
MTDLEALMWRLGARYPERRSTMTLVIRFDHPVPSQVVLDRLAAVAAAVPRLRARVVLPVLPLAPPTWETNPDFDISAHLRRARGRDGRPLDLMRVATDVVSRPFADGRPPWTAVFVPAVAGSPGSGLVLHLHHSYTDGVGGLLLAAALFDLPDGAELLAPAPDPPSPERGVWPELAAELEGSARLVGRVLPWAIRSLAGEPDAAAAVSETAQYLAGQLAAVSGPSSPIMASRSGGLHLDHLGVPLLEMRAAGRELGATVNDVFLSGLLGGLARYHDKHGALPPSIRLGIPMSTRDPGRGDMHNQLFAAALRGPLAVRDPDQRTRLVHEMVGEARRAPLSELVEDLAGFGRRLPGAESLLALVTRALDVVASNVPGPPGDLRLGGVRVAEMVPFGPRSGAALNATLLSYAGSAHIGLNVDPVAVPDHDVLLDCLRTGFDELVG